MPFETLVCKVKENALAICLVLQTLVLLVIVWKTRVNNRKGNKAAKFKEEKEKLNKLFDEINSVEGQPPQFYHSVYQEKLGELIAKYGNHAYPKSKYEEYDEDQPQIDDATFAVVADKANYRLNKKELKAEWAPRRSSMNIIEWAKGFTAELKTLWALYGIKDEIDEKRFYKSSFKPCNDDAEECCVHDKYIEVHHFPIENGELGIHRREFPSSTSSECDEN